MTTIILWLWLASALYVGWCLLFDCDEPRQEPDQREVWRLMLERIAKPN